MRVMKFLMYRVANRTDGDRQGEALQQREVNMDVDRALEPGEAAGDKLEALADGIEIVSPFLRRKIGKVAGTSSLRRKVENFSYCLRKAFLKNNGRRDGHAE